MRRLKTRLDALERSRQSELTAAATDMLVTVYGRLHALFMPARNKPESWPTIRRHRLGYVAGQRGVAARAVGADDWKSSHDARTQLITNGLAVAVKGDTETTGLILTPQGRSVAYAMVCRIIPAVPLAADYVERLKDAKPDRVRGAERWVSESTLFGFDCVGPSDQWQDFTDIMLEPCATGAVDSLCDLRGVCYYRWLHAFESLPIAEGVEPSEQAIDAYVAAFVAEMDRRHRVEETSGEVVIPLSVT
jgi:hypothetical protein